MTDGERARPRPGAASKVSGRNFGVVIERPASFNLTTPEPMLEDLRTRLADVVIECQDDNDFAQFARPERQTPQWGHCGVQYGME